MGLLDNLLPVEEIHKRRKAALAKSRFNETGSVMAKPIGEEWQPENVRPGGHALEAPMFSPDDLIGSGIFSKLGLLASSAAPVLAHGLLGTIAKNKGVSTLPSRLARVSDKQAGAIAWHGSPHKFDKFDMSKIGTGEGAQAYGHGLYMAENKNVADQYLNAGLTQNNVVIGGRALRDAKRNMEWIDSISKGEINRPLSRQGNPVSDQWVEQMRQEFKQDLDNAQAYLDKQSYKPSLYKVDIPDEAVSRFLDWDKPLSQQAPEVRAAIAQMRDKFPISKNGWDIRPWMDSDPLASTWHNEAVRELGVGQDFFTKELSSAGVPGIRYLDGGSRSAGQGSSNFVLFDDQLPRILERNGEPTGLQPWAKGEWKGLLSQ